MSVHLRIYIRVIRVEMTMPLRSRRIGCIANILTTCMHACMVYIHPGNLSSLPFVLIVVCVKVTRGYGLFLGAFLFIFGSVNA